KYPIEYIIQALAPTTELDFDRLPAERRRIYRQIQAMHVHGSPDGPWFFIIARNLGKSAGFVRCESEGDAEARNRWSGADGLFQFMPSTWRAVASRRDRPRLSRKAASDVTVARQLKQALWLRDNVGIRQWTCWRSYGRGSSWVWVSNEIKPRNPARCARQLRRNYGRSKKLANSVCGVK
ncbi:MAG: transglycosylase family protein, partial [Acidimicrobiales bacterium]